MFIKTIKNANLTALPVTDWQWWHDYARNWCL